MVGDKFIVEYTNGFTQIKTLIPHEEYLNNIKVSNNAISNLRVKNRHKGILAKKLRKYLSDTYGDNWFTDKSPLYKAIFTGFMESPLCSSNTKIPCNLSKL